MIQMGHEQASAVGSGATIRPPNPIATLRQVPTSSSSIAYGPPDMSEQAALAGMMSFEASILNCTALTRKPSDGSAHSGDLADHHRPLHHGNGALLSTTSLHNNNNNGGGGFTPGPRPRPVHGSNHKAPYLHPVAAMDGAPATELAAGGPAGVSHNSNAASAHARFPRNNAVRQELVRKCLAGVEEEKRLMNAASDPGIAANVSLGRIPSNTDDLESPEASEVSDSMSLSGSDEDSVPNGHDRRRAAPPKNVTEELSSSLSSSGCSPCTTSVDGFVIQGGEAARQRRSTLRESLGTSLVVLRSAAPMSPSPQGAAAEGPSPPSSSFSGTTSSSSLAGSSPTTTGSSKSSSGRRTSRLRESISLSPVAEAHDGEVEAATPENASAALDGLLRNYFDDGTTSEAATEMDDSAPPSESCDSAAGTFTPVTEAAMSPTSSMYRMPSSQPATSLQRVDPKKPISQPPNHSTRANTVPVTISPTTARAPMASPPITPTTPTSPSTAMTPAVMCDAAVVRQLVAYATIPFQYVLTLPPPAPRRRSTALASGKSVGLQVRISGGDGPNSGAADSLHRVEIPSTGSSGSSSGRRAAARTTFPNAHFAPSPPALTEALARGKALDVDNGTNPANPDDSPIATGLALMMHHPGAAATQVKFAPPPWIVADVDGTRRTGVLRGTPAAADVGEWGVEVVDLREADPGAARLHEVIVWKAVVRVTAR
ncbi:hypothetical protein BC828DRAFT_392985 [Blastocladiella britannica]|nr:hypothetical protein BC828DRAFT_392985 [Blastocladiella britannica]